jgi:adenylate kinase
VAVSRRIVVLLGPPGAGKGTQARALMDACNLPQIATGDMLRDAVARRTPLGVEAKKVMDRGELVGDELVNGIVAERVQEKDCESGFILDGYPRNLSQAAAFQSLIGENDQLSAIEIGVDTDALVARLTARLTCSRCKAVYNTESHPPGAPGVCDRCGGELVNRSDDTESVIRDRMSTYRNETEPLIRFYEKSGDYQRVDGMGAIDEVTKALVSLVCGVAGTRA